MPGIEPARRTSGSSCATIGCRTGSSNPSRISSTLAATPGINSSISLGKSSPSLCAIGPTGHDQRVSVISPLNPDASLLATELRALGARVGVNLTPESVALPGLRFTAAFMLSYNGGPLGVVAYVDSSGAPVLLCIIANDAPDAPMRSERRDNLSLAWWSRGGRSRLVIGRIPEEQAVALAQTLEKRI